MTYGTTYTITPQIDPKTCTHGGKVVLDHPPHKETNRFQRDRYRCLPCGETWKEACLCNRGEGAEGNVGYYQVRL